VCLEFSCKSLEHEVTPVRAVLFAPIAGLLKSSVVSVSCCLEPACASLQTCALEEEAYPALDELSSNVSTLNLERVRQIKSRLLAISGRVQKVSSLGHSATS
jgi:hypothetical protein